MNYGQPEKIFNASFVVLMLLSTLILLTAETYLFPQILGFPIIIFAYYLVDIRKYFKLPATFAAYLGLAAFALGFWEFYTTTSLEARILPASHLVSYLIWITMLQEKTPRQYWWLIAMSVVQIAVASVLTNEVYYGIGVMFYQLVVIWTLSYFSIYKASLRIKDAVQYVKVEKKRVESPSEEMSKEIVYSTVNIPALPKSTARGSIYLVPGESWLSWQYFSGVVVFTTFSLLVASLFFAFIPKGLATGIGSDRGLDTNNVSGFTESVRLGEMGSIMENPTSVLKVVIRNSNTKQPVNPEEFCTYTGTDALLFRGSVMSDYIFSRGNSRWKAFQFLDKDRDNYIRSSLPGGNLDVSSQYFVEIEQKQTTGNYICTTGSYRSIDDPSSLGTIRYDLVNSTAINNNTDVAYIKYNYYAIKPKIVDNHFSIDVTGRNKFQYKQIKYLERCTAFKEDELKGIKDFTDKLVLGEKNRLGTTLRTSEIAFFLEKHLQTSPEFSYSLKQTVIDRRIDPVEDFLINRKSGHCEYFASALALMLRSQKIPSRLVSGFKGGSFNPENNEVDVKQLHAHAWLEYFDEERSLWTTLDPTPSAPRDEEIAQLEAESGPSQSLYGIISNFWSSHVVHANPQSQNENIYTPLKEHWMKFFEKTKNIRNTASTLWDGIRDIIKDPKKLFSTKGLFTLGTLILVPLTVVLALTWLYRSIKKRMRLQYTSYKTNLRVQFYERFKALMLKFKISRAEEQTPLEFSANARLILLSQFPLFSQAELFDRLTLVYYKIRFGQYEVSEEEQRECITILEKLENELTPQ